jgi:hypothetical protein
MIPPTGIAPVLPDGTTCVAALDATMLHLQNCIPETGLIENRSPFMRRALPLLLVFTVLLAHALALTHRIAHPNLAQRFAATASIAPASTASTHPAAVTIGLAGGGPLDILFGHAAGLACDDFDAAVGLDANPGQADSAVVATVASRSAPAAPAIAALSSHPPGLFLARAPPRA